jgi:hypothetical protein
MTSLIPPRLRKPAGYALAGTVFAAAWLIRGGHAWWLAIVIEITIIVPVVMSYRNGGQADALVGPTPDERQRLLATRSRALAGTLAAVASFIGLSVAVAMRSSAWWPFLIVLAVAGFGYLLGLSVYGVGEEGPSDDEADDEAAGLSLR